MTSRIDRVRVPAVLVTVGAGAAVAVALGAYGNIHDPTGRSLVTALFTATINLKVWLTSSLWFFTTVEFPGF